MLKVWIVGSNGQMGTALNELIDTMEMEVLNTDKDELDITETDEVLLYGEINRPDVIINCAAITDTKICEENPELAYRVNAIGARNLSIIARKIGAKVVQLSTDDVFDGMKKVPYTEFDDTNPITVYGRSKRAGENYVKEFTHKHFVIRSNWVYGKGESNFVAKLLKLADADYYSYADQDDVWFDKFVALAKLFVSVVSSGFDKSINSAASSERGAAMLYSGSALFKALALSDNCLSWYSISPAILAIETVFLAIEFNNDAVLLKYSVITSGIVCGIFVVLEKPALE